MICASLDALDSLEVKDSFDEMMVTVMRKSTATAAGRSYTG